MKDDKPSLLLIVAFIGILLGSSFLIYIVVAGMYDESGFKHQDDITALITQKDIENNRYILYSNENIFVCTPDVYSGVSVGSVYILKFDNANQTMHRIVIEAVGE